MVDLLFILALARAPAPVLVVAHVRSHAAPAVVALADVVAKGGGVAAIPDDNGEVGRLNFSCDKKDDDPFMLIRAAKPFRISRQSSISVSRELVEF